MALINDNDRKVLMKEFEALEHGITLRFFSKKDDCEQCVDIRQVLDEVSGISDKITVIADDIEDAGSAATRHGVQRAPAIVVTDDNDSVTGVRFYGIPSGYEFASLISAIMKEGSGKLDLSEETKRQIEGIRTPVHIQVFVTPSCPYCPPAVVMAHQLAKLNPHITADMVEAMEFPELAQKYRVRGVPRVVINESAHFEGAQPETSYVKHVLDAAQAAQ